MQKIVGLKFKNAMASNMTHYSSISLTLNDWQRYQDKQTFVTKVLCEMSEKLSKEHCMGLVTHLDCVHHCL